MLTNIGVDRKIKLIFALIYKWALLMLKIRSRPSEGRLKLFELGITFRIPLFYLFGL